MATTFDDFQSILSDYNAVPGTYDELFAADGTLTKPYERLVSILNRIGREEFDRRWLRAERVLRENGIAFSGYSGKVARPRTWQLDAIPLLIEDSEWNQIRAAIQQRARLLNLVTKDLYGPQDLLRRGVLPPSLVYSDPTFAYHNIGKPPAEDTWLHIYAADLARSPDGKWWIMTDRTDAPSGLGYALEHRIVVSRLLYEAYNQCNVKRLAPFFSAFHSSLKRLAHRDRENPLTVLLSDGQVNPYHLEDAYLARYLGYMLVEDGDLTVRSSHTMLKTLGGLKQVDVILRHQNSSDSDPLVYPSVQGVAGLTQSNRSQHVSIANPIGSGLVESAAYMAFAPRLCGDLLGEELLLPNVATWWCGEPDSLNYVLANIENLIIQPAYRRRGQDGPMRQKLASMTKDELAKMIRDEPTRYVGQERVTRSSVIAWGEPPTSGYCAMRCYSVADFDAMEQSGSDELKYQVMDGGLGRVTSASSPLELTIRDGETSKDVWILAEKPVKFVSLLNENAGPAEIRRTGADLPSRVADNLFWLGRRMERVENYARLVRVALGRLVGETEVSDLAMLIRCLAENGLIEPTYAVPQMSETLPDIRIVLPQHVFNDGQSDTLRYELVQIKQLAARLRDRLSIQAWRVIQSLDRGFQEQHPQNATAADLIEVIDELLVQIAAISGMVMENMTRTQIYQFLDLGKRIERAHQTVGFLTNGVMFANRPTKTTLEATLELGDSLMTYRSRYLANTHTEGVLDLLITDEKNPRSLAYQFNRAQQHIEQLPPQDDTTTGMRDEQRLIVSLATASKTFNVNAARGLADHRHELDQWSEQITTLSRLISHRYLVHASEPHQLSDIGGQ